MGVQNRTETRNSNQQPAANVHAMYCSVSKRSPSLPSLLLPTLHDYTALIESRTRFSYSYLLMTFSNSVSSSSETRKPSMSETAAGSSVLTDSRFSCNICLDAVTEPVVTQCGHLYCWPCMYQWLEPGMLPDERLGLGLGGPTNSNGLGWLESQATAINAKRRVCPVCKAACSVTALVPIYVRNENDELPEQQSYEQDQGEENVLDETEQTSPLSPPRQNEQDNQGLGLKKRLVQVDDSANPRGDDCAPVPARPAANSPQRVRTDSRHTPNRNPPQQQMASYNRRILESPNRSPSAVFLGSLTQGMALMLQQQQEQQQTSSSTDPSASPSYTRPSIPPLQRFMDRDGNFRSSFAPGTFTGSTTNVQVEDPDATEVLSRLLLMLGSFVLLCLLIF
jgi:hypothetical protein